MTNTKLLEYIKKNIDNPCISDAAFRQTLSIMHDKIVDFPAAPSQPRGVPIGAPEGYTIIRATGHCIKVGADFSEAGNECPEFIEHEGIVYRRGGLVPGATQMQMTKYCSIREYEAV